MKHVGTVTMSQTDAIRDPIHPPSEKLERPKAPIESNLLKRTQNRRKSFTVDQLLQLELQFAITRYLKGQSRLQLARRLNLTEAQVKVW